MMNGPEGGNPANPSVREEGIVAEQAVEPADLPDVQSQPTDFPTREATEADIDAMALILEQANAHAAGEAIPEAITNPAKHQEVIRRMGYPGVRAQLAIDGVNIAGFVLVQPSSTEETIAPNDDTDYLALLMTAPAYWGRGVGGQLLDSAAESAREAGNGILCYGRPKVTIEQDSFMSVKGMSSLTQLGLVPERVNWCSIGWI